MAFRLSMGQYWPARSLLHRLDPRAKVACALAIMVSVFFVHTPVQLAFGWAAALCLVALSRVPVGKVLASIRPVVFMLLVLSLCNLLLTRSGSVLLALGPVTITSGGVWAAVVFSLRLVVAVIAAALLLLTTTPTQLTDAFDAALAPLSRLGLPGHELAMVFSLMLRFIPTLDSSWRRLGGGQPCAQGTCRRPHHRGTACQQPEACQRAFARPRRTLLRRRGDAQPLAPAPDAGEGLDRTCRHGSVRGHACSAGIALRTAGEPSSSTFVQAPDRTNGPVEPKKAPSSTIVLVPDRTNSGARFPCVRKPLTAVILRHKGEIFLNKNRRPFFSCLGKKERPFWCLAFYAK